MIIPKKTWTFIVISSVKVKVCSVKRSARAFFTSFLFRIMLYKQTPFQMEEKPACPLYKVEGAAATTNDISYLQRPHLLWRGPGDLSGQAYESEIASLVTLRKTTMCPGGTLGSVTPESCLREWNNLPLPNRNSQMVPWFAHVEIHWNFVTCPVHCNIFFRVRPITVGRNNNWGIATPFWNIFHPHANPPTSALITLLEPGLPCGNWVHWSSDSISSVLLCPNTYNSASIRGNIEDTYLSKFWASKEYLTNKALFPTHYAQKYDSWKEHKTNWKKMEKIKLGMRKQRSEVM